jgi:hypothetical protein
MQLTSIIEPAVLSVSNRSTSSIHEIYINGIAVDLRIAVRMPELISRLLSLSVIVYERLCDELVLFS